MKENVMKIILRFAVIFVFLLSWSPSSAREMLLFVGGGSVYYYVFQLLPTGQLIFSGEILTTGSDYHYGIAISPDQKYIWTSYSNASSQGVMQYAVTIYGQITATGRSVQLSGIPDDLRFTPNGQLIISDGGPIFRVNPDSSIQTTANEYSGDLNISPRGDINYSRGGYPEAFRIDYVDYTFDSLTTLEVVTASDEDQPQLQAVYRPAGDYIAYTYFGGDPGGVEVRRVLPNGIVDTTQTWDYEPGIGGSYIDITPDGNNIYANHYIHLSWSSQSSMFIDKGDNTTTEPSPLQLKVSPDGQFLVANIGYTSLKTFSIQTDGSLVDTGYTFNFGSTFNTDYIDGSTRLIFDWTPLPTSVPEELWGKLDGG